MNHLTRSSLSLGLLVSALAASSVGCATTTPAPTSVSGERIDSRSEPRERTARIEPRMSFR